MNSSPFFSIIIPVYNGLSHDLPICLERIWEQNMDKQSYEVICVDDCSTDNTRNWLRAQQLEHKNLRIIENQINVRQGGARNNGVRAAKGEYIMFIDQDDYYHPDSINKVYEFLKNSDLDILVTDSAFHFKNTENNKLQLNFKHNNVMRGEEFLKKNGFVFAPWRVVIRRNFYLQHGFVFVEKVRIEDVDWGCRLVRYAERIQYQPILLVHYIQAETGTTDNMYRDKQTLIDEILAGKRVMDVANECYSNSTMKQCVIDVADGYFYYSCRYMLGLKCSFEEKKRIISLIPNIESKYKLVRIVKTHPTIYAFISNLSVPVFRLVRKVFRWYKKMQ